MQQVISTEKAREEVNAFLDFKKIGPSKRRTYESSIEELVEAVAYGDLVIGSEKCTYNLKHPITSGDIPIISIELKKRLGAGELTGPMKMVQPTDIDGRYLAYIRALSDQPHGVVSKLDTVDLDLIRSYVNFFI